MRLRFGSPNRLSQVRTRSQHGLACLFAPFLCCSSLCCPVDVAPSLWCPVDVAPSLCCPVDVAPRERKRKKSPAPFIKSLLGISVPMLSREQQMGHQKPNPGGDHYYVLLLLRGRRIQSFSVGKLSVYARRAGDTGFTVSASSSKSLFELKSPFRHSAKMKNKTTAFTGTCIVTEGMEDKPRYKKEFNHLSALPAVTMNRALESVSMTFTSCNTQSDKVPTFSAVAGKNTYIRAGSTLSKSNTERGQG